MLPRWVSRIRFDRSLLTTSFLTILAVAFLGFMTEYVLRPVVPLIILDRGGGAAIVGLLGGVYALPPLVLRPFIGHLADFWHPVRVLRAGTLLAAGAPVGLLLPGIAPLVPTRLSQGTAWALWNVSTRTLMARASPISRRGAASGYFLAMPALAVLIAPGLGVALYVASGPVGPIVLASTLGMMGFIVTRLRFTAATPPPADIPPLRRRAIGWTVEPSVLPATVMTATFMAAETLFTIFPPVYIAMVGDAVETLALYYPAYGAVTVVAYLTAGSMSDRLGRDVATRIGCVLAAIGLTLALLGDGLAAFGVGAAAYAVGSSFVGPALSALSIDRAPTDRLGSAMATYSMSYQLAIGGSSLLWGALISTAGFDAAIGGAILLVLVTMAASYRYGGAHDRRRR